MITAAFRPTAVEIEAARAVLDTVSDADDLGGALLLPDGRFVDAAVVRQARRVLELT